MSTEAIPRITGTEMEWSLRYIPNSSKNDGEAAFEAMDSLAIRRVLTKHLLPHIPHLGTENNAFLANGSRLYIDIGEHLEYATSEDASFMGTVANEIASEELLLGAFARAKKAGNFRDFAINRRVVDDGGITWGYHESYCVPANKITISSEVLALLGVHMTTRNVLFGAGYVDRRGDYKIAQKNGALFADFATGTQNSGKPIVNLRNEPHAVKEKWLRVHMTSGDPNMSPWATFMKLATTSLVLRLIENEHTMDWLRFRNDLYVVAAMVAGDVTLRKTVELDDEDHTTIRPIEVQQELANAARLLSEKIRLPDEELLALDEWERAAQDAAENPLHLIDRSDWVAKKAALDRYRNNHGINWNSHRMRAKDRQWDLIGPAGIGRAMRQKAWTEWMPADSLVTERMGHPARTTRANARGTFVRTFADSPNAHVDWTTARVHANRSMTMYEPDGSDAGKIWNQIRQATKAPRKLSA